MILRRFFNWLDHSVIDSAVNLAGVGGKRVGFAAGALDRKCVDGAVNATADGVMAAGGKIIKFQSGRLRDYLGYAFGGGVLLAVINYIFMK